MSVVTHPLVAIVGHKKSKLAMMGGVRVLVLRDGMMRMLNKKGEADFEFPADALTARLTVTKTVELTAPSGSVIIYLFSEKTTIHAGIKELAVRESSDAEYIGPTPSGLVPGFVSLKDVTGPAKAARGLVEALHERGVGAG